MSPNTEFEVPNFDWEYSEEFKLNIKCDNDDGHIAVLYCPKCEVNLCIMCCEDIHCFRAISKHQVVRLTEKPQPPVDCYLHSQKAAELICKEPSCDGINKPICVFCQQYGTHKNHKIEILENEYKRIRTTITNYLEEVEIKTKTCERGLDEYKRCISTYSTTDDDFMKSECDKIEKFYSDAKTLALKTLEDFANDRIKTLEQLQKQYENDKTKLDIMKNVLLGYEKMAKKDLIENEENVEAVVEQDEQRNDGPGKTLDLIPSKCYNIIYPDVETINIKAVINSADVTKYNRFQNFGKTPAVYFAETRFSPLDPPFRRKLDSFGVKSAENLYNGILSFYNNGQTILQLKNRPASCEIDTSKYKYISVLAIWCGLENFGVDLLEEQIENDWCSKIIVLSSVKDLEKKKHLEDKIQRIADRDNRVKVIYDFENLRELLFED